MRRIGEFQLNSPKLDSVYNEVVEARGQYSTLKARLDDIGSNLLADYKITEAVLDNGGIVVTIAPGLAFINETPVLTRSDVVLRIDGAADGQWYYIYLGEDGVVSYSDAPLDAADKLLLGRVSCSAGSVSIEDMRPFLQKGGVTKEIYEARGAYDSLGQRLDAIEAGAIGYTFSEVYVAQEGQQEFVLQHKYPVGAGKLRVFVDGLLMGCGEQDDYVEVDAHTVRFNYPLPQGAVVRFLVENAVPGMGFTEVHTAEPEQTVFHLAYPYPYGTGRLRVFVNGVLYTPGSDNDYVEVDEYTVQFNDPFLGGERIHFIVDGVDIESAACAGGYTSLSHRLNSRLADCNVDIMIEYDENDRVIRETWSGQINKTIEFLYDEKGNRVAEIETEGNLVITTTYEYDDRNRISRMSIRKEVRL
jgi:hypothetical protein